MTPGCAKADEAEDGARGAEGGGALTDTGRGPKRASVGAANRRKPPQNALRSFCSRLGFAATHAATGAATVCVVGP